MLTLQNVSLSYGARVIFDDVSFQIRPHEKIGLIGANGTGKTTLLRIIAGRQEPDAGIVDSAGKYISCAVLSQILTVKPHYTLYEEMLSSVEGLRELEMKMKAAEEEMSAFADDEVRLERAIARYGRLQEEYEHLSGRDVHWKIDKIIQGIGFTLADKQRRVSEFSGGWQMRIELAKLLLREVDLLLLDEPTNHLDLRAVAWLEEYLSDYAGTVILVSHDRYFLNRTVSRIFHLSQGKVDVYPGNYDGFVQKRAENRALQEKAYKNQQKKLEQEQRFIERFRYKASLASRVKSREKLLEKRELVDMPETEGRSISLDFEFEQREMSTVFEFKDLRKHYAGKTVSYDGSLEIKGGDRIAFVGDNGCGKSTLMNILSGCDREFEGRLKRHAGAEIQYYLQNQERFLVGANTVMEELQRTAPPAMTVTALRTLLGCFLFRGDDVFKKVEVLSGGEKARLVLAMTVCASSNVVLLDEPTNHLDIDSRESLSDALASYRGTIIMVSHDRYFIDQICNRIIELADGTVRCYEGNYTYYRMKKEAELAAVGKNLKEPLKKPLKKPVQTGKVRKGTPSVDLSYRKRMLRKEEEICRLEEKLKNIEKVMTQPEIMENSEQLLEISQEYGELQARIEELFEEYEKLSQYIDF